MTIPEHARDNLVVLDEGVKLFGQLGITEKDCQAGVEVDAPVRGGRVGQLHGRQGLDSFQAVAAEFLLASRRLAQDECGVDVSELVPVVGGDLLTVPIPFLSEQQT